MTGASFIVAIALAKLLLGILAARRTNSIGPSPSSRADSDDEEGFTHVLHGQQFDDSPTGNLASEEYSFAAGSRQDFGDFRDPDEYSENQFSESSDQGETHSFPID
jgi:hypothetical protein